MIFPDRWVGLPKVLDWVTDLDAVLVSVEYRVAPEDPYPAPLDDCYAGLLWMAAQATELGYDPARLAIAGASAGGGLAAGVTLRARDSSGPALAAQVLIYPMLDDRNETTSSYQFDGFGPWNRASNDTGWDAYLGDRRRSAGVPGYAAPARATDLSGLPPTFIDVGSAEVFRDEDVAYASRIWADGGSCELHVWPGGSARPPAPYCSTCWTPWTGPPPTPICCSCSPPTGPICWSRPWPPGRAGPTAPPPRS
jgi:acetyl esterase/lipase